MSMARCATATQPVSHGRPPGQTARGAGRYTRLPSSAPPAALRRRRAHGRARCDARAVGSPLQRALTPAGRRRRLRALQPQGPPAVVAIRRKCSGKRGKRLCPLPFSPPPPAPVDARRSPRLQHGQEGAQEPVRKGQEDGAKGLLGARKRRDLRWRGADARRRSSTRTSPSRTRWRTWPRTSRPRRPASRRARRGRTARSALPRLPPFARAEAARRAQTAMTKREITACKDMVKRDDKWEALVK